MTTAYREQIEAPLVNFNVSQSISDINAVITSLMDNGVPANNAVITTLNGIVTRLENIRDVLIPNLQSRVVSTHTYTHTYEGSIIVENIFT